jgi:hypothetical protein
MPKIVKSQGKASSQQDIAITLSVSPGEEGSGKDAKEKKDLIFLDFFQRLDKIPMNPFFEEPSASEALEDEICWQRRTPIMPPKTGHFRD